MKSSKSSISLFIAALSVSTIFVMSVFTARSTVAARAGMGRTMSTVTPVKGIDVIVNKGRGEKGYCPQQSMSRQTDAEGSFTVGDLTPCSYDVSLQCNARCQSMNDLSAGSIQFDLTGAKENPFKRNITKQQLVAGVKFPIEIDAVGRSKEPRYIRGHVSLLK